MISLEQLQDLRTQAAMAGAQFKSAQFNLGYSVITAPRDGMVLRKLAEERELVPAGTPVLVFGESDRGYVVRAALADREIVNVKLGDKGEIRMDAFPGQAMTGTVVEIASAADERSGMFPVEVQFDSPPPRLVSGLVARLRLAPTTGSAAAHLRADGRAGRRRRRPRQRVRDRRRQRAQRRDVRVAFITADSIALESGVAPGEAVVTDGALYLENGEARRGRCATPPSRRSTRRRRPRKLSAPRSGRRACRSSNSRSAATSSRWSRSCAWSRSAGTRSASVPREEDPVLQDSRLHHRGYLPGRGPEGSRAAGRRSRSRTASPRSTTCMKMETSIRDGVSFTAIEFETYVDADKKYDEVTREVNALRPELPAGDARSIIRQLLARAW